LDHHSGRLLEKSESFTKRHGLKLDDAVKATDFVDRNSRETGHNAAKLRAFLLAIERGFVTAGSYLIIEDLEQASRGDLQDLLQIFQGIIGAGITVVTIEDGREYSWEAFQKNPLVSLEGLITALRAHAESHVRSQRQKAAWQRKRDRGGPTTARCPAWLKLDKESNSFQVIEDRAEIVRRIYNLYVSGMGQYAIAERLNRESVPTFGSGQRWGRSYLGKLLSTRAVLGEYIPHITQNIGGKTIRIPQEPIKEYFPAIINRATYDHVQSLAGTTNPQRGRHAGAPVRNLLGGLAKCPICASAMTRVTRGPGNRAGKPTLVCSRAKSGAGCRYRSVSQSAVETALIDGLPDHLLGSLPAGGSELDLAKVISDTETAVAAAEIRLTRLLHDIETGGSSPRLSRVVRTTEAELEQDRARLSKLRDERDAFARRTLERRASNLYDAISYRPIYPPQVNALLRQLFASVTVDYPNGDLVLNWRHGAVSSISYDEPT
jgi:DNA invertase Pin-like site-specific DNA recombinase